MYKLPELRQSMVNEWTNLAQESSEDLTAFLCRVQDHCEKTWPKMAPSERENMAITAFIRGMANQNAATFVSSQSPTTTAKALQVAASVVSRLKQSPEAAEKITNYRRRNTKYQLYMAGEQPEQDEQDEFEGEEEL